MCRSGKLYVLTAFGLLAGMGYAQTAPQDVPGKQASISGSLSQSAVQPDSTAQPVASSSPAGYAAALDGSGLIPLDHSVRSRLLLGVGYGGGYDSRPEEISGASGSAISVFSPFVGLQVNRENVQYVFQYLPTFSHYADKSYEGGSLHTGMATLTGNASERWDWELHGIGMHGLDSVRLLAPQPAVAVGEVPGNSSAAASYRNNAGTVTYIDFDGRMSYHLSDRDAVSATVSHSYGTSTSSVGDTIVAGLKGAFSRDVSPTLQWAAYGQGARYYGALHCYSYGAGAAVTWRPGEHSFVQVGGGPQLDSPACGKQQNLAYRVSYSARLTERSQVYFLSARETAGAFVGPGLWEQNLSTGYQRKLSRVDSAGISLGYVNETLFSDKRSYSGIYTSASYAHRLPRNLSAGFNYRYFDGGWTGSRFNRNTALFSLTWLPTSGHVFQQ